MTSQCTIFFFLRVKPKTKKQKQKEQFDLWELAEKPLRTCCTRININQAMETIWWMIDGAQWKFISIGRHSQPAGHALFTARSFFFLQNVSSSYSFPKIFEIFRMGKPTLNRFLRQGGSGTTSLAWKYIKVCGYSDLFAKTWTKGHWPLDDLWSHICWGLMCESTQGSLCPSPMKIHQSMWIQWPFLQKTWTKGHWPLDDLWPHICRGHMCDSTQGSLCPSPMGIHQCMWIQWWIQ